MMEKADDPCEALLSNKNTLLDGVNLSPAQMLMGRRLRSFIPVLRPDIPMEIESDAAPVATIPDNPETRPAEMPVTTIRSGRTIPEPERFKDYIKY